MKTTKLPPGKLAQRRRRKKVLLAQAEELKRKAIIRLIEEAETILLTLELDDLAAGDYPHLARAIKDMKEWI